MQMIHCPNCGKLTGFKRALGFGTFFMVLITCGLWLLVIPLYPMRCITCGLTRSSAAVRNFLDWLKALPPRTRAITSAGILLGAVALVALLSLSRSSHTDSASDRASSEVSPSTQTAISHATPVPQAEPPFQKAQVSASVEQLMIDRQTGEAAAAERYLGKIIEVRGIVDTANSTGDSPSISFKATGSCVIEGGNSVNCFWMAERERDAVAKLHPGDSVTVLGRFSDTGRYHMPKEFDFPNCAYHIDLSNCTVKTPMQSASLPEKPSAEVRKQEPSQGPPQTVSPPETAVLDNRTPDIEPAGGRRAGGRVYLVGGDVLAPKVLYDPDPDYSEEARRAKYQGPVDLRLIVESSGAPSNIRVVRGLTGDLDRNAVEAVRRWKFRPALKDGKPVAVQINVTVNYRLY